MVFANNNRPSLFLICGFAGGSANLVCRHLRTVYAAYPGCVAPTGLKQWVFFFTHRLRSGLRLLHPDGVPLPCPFRGNTTVAHRLRSGLQLLHPDGVSLPCPVRGNTTVAHCVSGGKAIQDVIKPRRGGTNAKIFKSPSSCLGMLLCQKLLLRFFWKIIF